MLGAHWSHNNDTVLLSSVVGIEYFSPSQSITL